jgi:hypothetical protein
MPLLKIKEDKNMNHNHEYHSNKPEIKANVVYRDGNIKITLEDEFNNAPLLDTMHEKKEMHFVLVSNDMEKYYHLHPKKKHEGLFIINQQLEPGTYQAFVDVTPKNHVYSVHPIELQIGDKITSTTSLNSDKNWVKVNKGVHVTLNSISVKEDEHVPLTFNTELTPQPYLGVLGHVIIFDEQLTDYIHVHPESPDSTTFYAHFPKKKKKRMYKIWAEFKFNDEVHRFTYNIKVA